MATRNDDKQQSSQHRPGESDSRDEQPGANIGRKQAGQTNAQQRQPTGSGSAPAKEERSSPARTADSSPGDPPGDRAGTAAPTVERGAAPSDEAGGRATADPRVDVATADSRPVPDGTTGSDRDTLKPGT